MRDKRTIDLGPGIPRMDIELLSAPIEAARRTVCIVCEGTGTRTVDPQAEPWDCHVCGGSGEIGGGP